LKNLGIHLFSLTYYYLWRKGSYDRYELLGFDIQGQIAFGKEEVQHNKIINIK